MYNNIVIIRVVLHDVTLDAKLYQLEMTNMIIVYLNKQIIYIDGPTEFASR